MVPSQILILPTKETQKDMYILHRQYEYNWWDLTLIIMKNKLPDSLVREHFDE